MTKHQRIQINDVVIRVDSSKTDNVISLTDVAKIKVTLASGIVIANWLSTKYTIQFIGAWEQLHNSRFNVMEFNNIKNEVGTHGYIVSSSRWIRESLKDLLNSFFDQRYLFCYILQFVSPHLYNHLY